MTAEDFADLVGARSVSPGKWAARCRAHRDYRGKLIITRVYNRAAHVRCLERCSIDDILESLSLTRHEFECPPVPEPDLLEMSDDELKAFRAGRRKRQAFHAATCERIRALRDEVNGIKEAIRTEESRRRFSDKMPLELMENLEDAELMLSVAIGLEVDLRDLDPSFQLWDPEDLAL